MMNDITFARDVLLREACRLLVHDLTIIAWELRHEVGPFDEALFVFASMTERTHQRVGGILHSLRILLESTLGQNEPSHELPAWNSDALGSATITDVEEILDSLSKNVIRPLKRQDETNREEGAKESLDHALKEVWHLRERVERFLSNPRHS